MKQSKELHEKIKEVLRSHGENQVNLTSESAVKKVTDDIIKIIGRE